MREIRFRGLRTDGKGWVYGYYFYDVQVLQSYIIDYESNVDVFSETVGQFTGLKDRNGKDIYDGDIISYGTISKEVKFETHKNQMCYGHGMYGMDINIGFVFSGYYGSIENVTVIGNIHE